MHRGVQGQVLPPDRQGSSSANIASETSYVQPAPRAAANRSLDATDVAERVDNSVDVLMKRYANVPRPPSRPQQQADPTALGIDE